MKNRADSRAAHHQKLPSKLFFEIVSGLFSDLKNVLVVGGHNQCVHAVFDVVEAPSGH